MKIIKNIWSAVPVAKITKNEKRSLYPAVVVIFIIRPSLDSSPSPHLTPHILLNWSNDWHCTGPVLPLYCHYHTLVQLGTGVDGGDCGGDGDGNSSGCHGGGGGSSGVGMLSLVVSCKDEL